EDTASTPSIPVQVGRGVSTSTSYLRSISKLREPSVIVGREILERLVVPVVDLGGPIAGAGVLCVAAAVVAHLRLAVGADQLVVGVFQRNDLPVQGPAVKSCDCHVLTLVLSVVAHA